MDRHPALRVDLILDDQRQDLVTEGVDVALRLGVLSDLYGCSTPDHSLAADSGRLPDYLRKGRHTLTRPRILRYTL